MTREEAHERLNDGESWKLINEIYDDLESRTCENCEYWTMNFHVGAGECKNNVTMKSCKNERYDTLIGFGCNKWEKKDD